MPKDCQVWSRNHGHFFIESLSFSLWHHKECVSLLIGLYKNNGSVLHVAIRWLFIQPLYSARTRVILIIINIPPVPWCIARCTLYFDTQLHGILSWADINRNGNIFLPPSANASQGSHQNSTIHLQTNQLRLYLINPISLTPSHIVK